MSSRVEDRLTWANGREVPYYYQLRALDTRERNAAKKAAWREGIRSLYFEAPDEPGHSLAGYKLVEQTVDWMQTYVFGPYAAFVMRRRCGLWCMTVTNEVLDLAGFARFASWVHWLRRRGEYSADWLWFKNYVEEAQCEAWVPFAMRVTEGFRPVIDADAYADIDTFLSKVPVHPYLPDGPYTVEGERLAAIMGERQGAPGVMPGWTAPLPVLPADRYLPLSGEGDTTEITERRTTKGYGILALLGLAVVAGGVLLYARPKPRSRR